jgi:hypothetical protein
LWGHLEHPDTWAVFSDAARNADGRILNGVVRIPADRLSENSRRRLVELLAGLASHSDAVIRLAVLQRFSDLPLPDGEGRLLHTALTSLTAASPDERASAARVIAAIAAPSDAPAVAAAVGTMRAQRRPLHDFVHVVTAQSVTSAPIRRRLTPLARAVLDVLRTDPITAGLRLTIAAGILGVEEFVEELKSLVDGDIPVSAVASDAITAIEQFGQTINRTKLPQLETRLAAADDPHLRLLALNTLIVQARDHDRWDEDRSSRLNAYRSDPAPLVAIRAQFFFEAD